MTRQRSSKSLALRRTAELSGGRWCRTRGVGFINPKTWAAGPASAAHHAALATCLDAVAATGQLAPGDLERLRDAADDLRSLAYLQPLLEQVPRRRRDAQVLFRFSGVRF